MKLIVGGGVIVLQIRRQILNLHWSTMHFKSFDLNQLTPEYVARLSKARVDELVEVLRNDLLAAQDLLRTCSKSFK